MAKRFIENLGLGGFCGTTFGDWLSVLRDNRYEIDIPFWPRAALITCNSVFQSTIHTWRKVKRFWGLQTGEVDEVQVLQDYVQVYDAFFAERHRLTERNFYEVRFAELERDPIGQIRQIHHSLELPDFDQAESALRGYVQSLTGYRRNAFPAMSTQTRLRVARAWDRSFEEWGYSK